MSHTLKQNNRHAQHPMHCSECKRALPKQAHNPRCAVCIKREQGKVCDFCSASAVIGDSGNVWCGQHYYQATGDATYLPIAAGAA